MDCTRFVTVLDGYFDDATDRAAADAHVAECAECRDRLAEMQARLRDLPCNEFVELVTDYLEDAVNAPDRDRMDQHLRLCEGCRTYLDQMRVTIASMRRLADPTDDPAARVALQAVFRAWRQDREGRAPR